MFNDFSKFTVMVGLGFVLLTGCQKEPEWPVDLGGGACGSYYPSEESDTDTDTGATTEYTFRKQDAIVPCDAWESVRKGEQGADPNTYINLGEIFLEAERAATDTDISSLLDKNWSIPQPTHMVVVASADECSACEALIGGGTTDGIADLKDDFEAQGTLMVAALRYHFTEDKGAYTLEQADEVLLEKDGWPSDWHRTNDEEELLGLVPGVDQSQSYPQAWVIRLSDMRVIAFFPEGSDAGTLLEIVTDDNAQL